MSPANPLEIVARFPGTLVHAWDEHGLLCSRANQVLVIEDLAHPQTVQIARLPWHAWQSVARWRLADRLLKYGVLRVERAPWGFLARTGGDWWHIEAGRAVRVAKYSSTGPMSRGMCTGADGTLYVAAYSLNPRRHAVRIHRSRDGWHFDTAWEFPPGSVRHVHALLRDAERPARIWVLTGDRDAECGIYRTDDCFRTLVRAAGGSQECRATDLVCRDGQLFWGMDSPDERAFMMRAPEGDPAFREPVFRLPGPAYYMTQNEAGGMYVGTTVERGKAARDRRAHLIRFVPGGSAEELLALQKDWVPQHGILYLPRGILPGDHLVFVPRAVGPHEGCLTIARDRLWG